MIPEYSRRPIGRSSTDFIYGVVATILQIVSSAANRIVKERLVDAKWEENKITNQLRQKVVEEKNLLNEERGGELALRVEGEVGTFHTTEGRIDIKVIYDWDEKNYFGIECKRLSGKNKGLDKKYVTDGLMRFITGKYSQGHQWGMMVGYVTDGLCERAIQFVQERIDEHRTCLRIEKEFTRETQFNNYSTLHSSRHRQKITATIIMILHYFFEIP
jgi:hypothetical protein